MNAARNLSMTGTGGELGNQLAAVAQSNRAKFLYGNGPSLADRLAASARQTKTARSEIINNACKALIHV